MAHRIWSIRTRLIVFLLVLILVPVVTGFLVYHRSASSLVRNQIIYSRTAVVEQTALNMDRIIGQMNTVVNYLSFDGSVDEFINAVDAGDSDEIFLSSQKVRSAMHMVSSAFFQHSMIASLVKGDAIVSTIPDVSRNRRFFTDSVWISAAKADPTRLQWNIEEYSIWTEDGFELIEMLTVSRSVQLRRSSSEPAVLAVSIELKQLSAILADTVYLNYSGILPEYVVNADYIIYAALENGWELIYAMAESELLGDLNELQTQGLLLILLISFLIGAVIIINVFMSTRSLMIIREQMEYIRDGDLSVRMPDFPLDEIGLLAQEINNMLDQINDLFERVRTEHALAEEARFAQLKSQIQPHFLLNSLNSISWAARLSGADNVMRISASLTAMLERILYEKSDFVRLSRELETLKQYLTLEDLRSGDRYDIEIAENHLDGDPVCPSFCIQPLVENAIKHGLDSHSDAIIQIRVRCVHSEDCLEIYVENTGSGFSFEPDSDEPEKPARQGIGLRNIHERLQAYFGADYGVTVAEGSSGFSCSVQLRMPYLEDSP